MPPFLPSNIVLQTTVSFEFEIKLNQVFHRFTALPAGYQILSEIFILFIRPPFEIAN
jgi:hypothetical protein